MSDRRCSQQSIVDMNNRMKSIIKKDMESIKREITGSHVTELKAGEMKPNEPNIKFYGKNELGTNE